MSVQALTIPKGGVYLNLYTLQFKLPRFVQFLPSAGFIFSAFLPRVSCRKQPGSA